VENWVGDLLEKNDICFSIKIDNNKIRAVRSKRREEVFKVNDLKQIFPY
jgi:hypothetical protein